MGSVRPDLPPLGDEIVDAVTAQELFLRSIAARCAHGGELIERNLDRDVLGTGVSQWIAAPLVVAIGAHPIAPVALAHLAGRRRVVHDNDPTTPYEIESAAQPFDRCVVVRRSSTIAVGQIAEVTVYVDVDQHVTPRIARPLSEVEGEVVEQFVGEHHTDETFVGERVEGAVPPALGRVRPQRR